jgi:hypothetical protein
MVEPNNDPPCTFRNFRRAEDKALSDYLRRSEESIWAEINNLRHTVYGNGKDGLSARLAVIEQRLVTMDHYDKARNRKEWAIIMMLIGLVAEHLIRAAV